MAGGLIQLVAVGIQDIYLIGNPQITFFKTVYKKYTNFAMESIQQPIDGRPDFGQQIEVTVQRKGDLIKDIIFEILLPVLPSGYYWANGIGNVLIKQVDLEIGGQLIDRHYSEWLDIWHDLTLTEGLVGAYNSMIGNYNSKSSLEENALLQLRLYVPMCFWFNRDYSLTLPLIALQYHDIVLKIHLRDFNSCYRNNDSSVLLSGYQIASFNVWVDYIHLDMEERRKYAQMNHEILIEQLQFDGNEYVGKDTFSISKKLTFNHPVKELYWMHTTNDFLQTNINTGNQLLNYFLPIVLDKSIDTFSSGVLQLNGVERFQKRSANYFRLVQNYQYHTRYSFKMIYTYSFSLTPDKNQPSGSCNMSKFTNINLFLEYDNTINHSNNDMILKVYAVNYNILRIMNGMAGLAFSN
jgi:hypothetical protein